MDPAGFLSGVSRALDRPCPRSFVENMLQGFPYPLARFPFLLERIEAGEGAPARASRLTAVSHPIL